MWIELPIKWCNTALKFEICSLIGWWRHNDHCDWLVWKYVNGWDDAVVKCWYLQSVIVLLLFSFYKCVCFGLVCWTRMPLGENLLLLCKVVNTNNINRETKKIHRVRKYGMFVLLWKNKLFKWFKTSIIIVKTLWKFL